jgi:hypothetical protein
MPITDSVHKKTGPLRVTVKITASTAARVRSNVFTLLLHRHSRLGAFRRNDKKLATPNSAGAVQTMYDAKSESALALLRTSVAHS